MGKKYYNYVLQEQHYETLSLQLHPSMKLTDKA